MAYFGLFWPILAYFGLYRDFVVLCCLFLISFAIGFKNISTCDVWLDEASSIYYSQIDLGEFFNLFTQGNNSPLYELLLRIWIAVFGLEPIYLRLFSVIIYSCIPIVLYSFLRRTQIKFFGKVAISLIPVLSTSSIYFASEIRAYSLLAFFATITFAYCAIFEFNKTRHFIIAGCLTALCLYTHYLSFFLCPFFVIILMLKNGEKLFSNYAKYIFTSVILFGPWFLLCLNRIAEYSLINQTWIEKPTSHDIAWVNRFLFNGEALGVVLPILAFGLLMYFMSKKKWHSAAVLLIPIVSYLIILLYSNLFVSIFIRRYIAFLSPVFLFALSIEVLKLTKGKYLYSLVVLACLPFFYFEARPHSCVTVSWRMAMPYYKALKTNRSITVVYPDFAVPSFTYYYDRRIISEADDMRKLLRNENVLISPNLDELRDLIESDQYETILYVGYHDEQLRFNESLKLLKKNCSEEETMKFEKIKISNFTNAPF